jgi:putative glutamine amidotransferase
MSPRQPIDTTSTSGSAGSPPQIGVSYRTLDEQLTNKLDKYDMYNEAVRRAGGEPVEVPLNLSSPDLANLTATLDAFVLTGSPADVDPARYRSARHPKCAPADPRREETDLALLKNAFAEHKPVLAICYGIQILNVFCGGTLIQDIPSEWQTTIVHSWDRAAGAPEPHHLIRIEPGSRLAELGSDATETEVNSSHHQAILEPGKGLRVIARAPDGIIEGVEWTGAEDWVTGVQWHPERMANHALSASLFRELVGIARSAQVRG